MALLQVEPGRSFEIVASAGTSAMFTDIEAPVYDAVGTETVVVAINSGKSEVSEAADFGCCCARPTCRRCYRCDRRDFLWILRQHQTPADTVGTGQS